MKALITGASSGIGKEITTILNDMGYDVIIVARNRKKLEKFAKELSGNVEIIDTDISSTFNCMKLYNKVKKEDIEIVINNAGFGLFGEFTETKIDKEMDMIDTNIKGVHTLTKLFLKDFKEKNRGYILNVASSAAFLSGPLMSTYYATKAYVLHLTEAINEELRRENSDVYVGALCPGPVDTNFNKVAGVEFNLKSMTSLNVAQYAVNKMFHKKTIIVPGLQMKLGIFATRLVPRKLMTRISYNIQRKKESKKS